MATPLTGLVVLGSNGEAAQLDDDEADRVVEMVREHVPRDRPLIAGTGRESTRATIAATRRAAAAGVDAVARADAVLLQVADDDRRVRRHYTEVADVSPVPVLLYNVSMFTGVNLRPDAVERLAAHSEHRRHEGIGQRHRRRSRELVSRTPDDFTVLAGSATTFFHALCAGCDGAILALAALVPDACVEMLRSCVSIGLDEARSSAAAI